MINERRPRDTTRNANAAATENYQNRRKKDDWVTTMASILSLVSWAVAFVVWVVVDLAAPEREHMFSRMFETQINSAWDTTLLSTAFFLLLASLLISIMAFVFNVKRKRRKTDKYKKSIIIIAVIAVVSIVVFLVRFGEHISPF